MRPVLLEMVGFGAFREPTTVGFDDVDVVALVGPTGSGKSTIIDAITFALYGSVARYGERDVAPAIHQLATEAKVRLVFEVAGVAHQVVRVVRRTPRGASTKEARLERRGEVLAGNARDVAGAVAGLLGIDASQFNKTVVLPQGRFAEFLHEEPRHRQALLRDVLGLGIYTRVAQAARQRAGEHRLQGRLLAGQVADAGDVSDDAVAAVVRRRELLDTARAEVATAAAELHRLVRARADAAGATERLDQEVAALLALAPPPDVTALAGRLADAAGALEEADGRLEKARRRRRAADADLETGPVAARCEALLARHHEHARLSERRVAAEASLDEAAGHLRLLAKQAEATRAEVAARRTALHEAQTARNALESLAVTPVAALEELQRAHADLAAWQARARSAAAAAHEAEEAAVGPRAALEAATRARAAAEARAPAAALAATLQVGAPCPVCEQPVTAMPSGHGHHRAAVAEARAAEQQAAAAARQAEQAAERAAAEARAAHEAREQVAARLAGAPDLAAVEAKLSAARSHEAACRDARAAVAACEVALREVEQAPATRSAVEGERAAERAVDTARSALEALGERIAELAAELAVAPPPDQLTRDLARALSLDAARRSAVAAEEEAEEHRHRAAAATEAARAAAVEARAAFAAARDSVVPLGPPPSTDDLAADWAALVAWAAEQAAVLGGQRAAAAAEVARMEGEAAAVTSALRHATASLVGECDDLGELRERLAAAAARAEEEERSLQDTRARVARIQEQLAGVEAQAGVAELLGELLGSAAFERWLLDEAMADLVERATRRLQALTAGQYSLVVDGGSFKVRDHRNADEVRDARSLSGGETFLASLALALALGEATVDLAARGSAPLDSIFLDEGFGTLDPDTLDVVAGTIEELASSGRMVGLVTHIRELAERMPTRFEVRRTATTSTVERVDL